jgi:outer membrane protein
MMRKIILTSALIISLVFAQSIAAQAVRQIAFVNSNELLEAIPEKVLASNHLIDLNNKYKEELKVMQNDYNKKYSDFISYQTSMAENIRLRRMQELYELERQINDFMKVAQEDINNKEKELIDPMRLRIKDAIYKVGVERGFVCIYDLANPAIAFVTPDATDATPFVKQKLGIKPAP